VTGISDIFKECKAIGVLDRDVAYGTGGVVFQDICRSLYNTASQAAVVNFILGLGGRDVTVATLQNCFEKLREYNSKKHPAPGQDVFWPDANVPLWKTWKVG
jgi:pyruvate ferredoxin oxidoreductase alpha subunit